MSSKREATRGLLIAISGLVAGCVALALLSAARFDSSSRLVNRYQNNLDSVPDEQVPQHLQEMASFGDESIAVLVESMGSDREVVAISATRVLRDKLASWRMLPPSESSSKVALLAHLLVINLDQIEPNRQTASADLATEILIWPVDQTSVDKDQIIADCEQILRIVASRSLELKATHRSSIEDSPKLPAEISDVPVLSRRGSWPQPLR